MLQISHSTEEMDRRAEAFYNEQIRPVVDLEENRGKLIVVDVESGDYEMDTDSLAMSKRMRARHPDAPLYQFRIGYGAVEAFGGFRLLPSKR